MCASTVTPTICTLRRCQQGFAAQPAFVIEAQDPGPSEVVAARPDESGRNEPCSERVFKLGDEPLEPRLQAADHADL
jgi:hypothetical protein